MPVTSFPISNEAEWLQWRLRDVTASDIGTLYGESPYKTAYQLCREKRGAPEAQITQTPDMEAGRDLEPVIRRKLQERFPNWRFFNPKRYLRDEEHRFGATPDLYAEDEDGKHVILQLKAVRGHILKKEWADVPPRWILFQTLAEASLADAAYGLTVAFDRDAWAIREPWRVDRYPALEAEMRERALAFMTMVDNDQEPAPDFGRDGALLAARFMPVPDKMIDLRHDNRMSDLCADWVRLGVKADEIEAQLAAIKAEVHHKLGDASVALVNGFSVTNKTIHKRPYTVKATSYPRLLINKKEEAA
jgi:predicted phage-related endonuclease